ncbi:hypothetical protein E2F50_22780 [Rhizobium deserti]|uniref:Uncharacterized protein n=1 Tax=Rhizobium deserti TaxID=2547961 RepID=A0A4R5U5E4_9HYPH|nr:hypothetical protein [Rhizobium deserti]TDK29118.1 hypothetical protein E2F50_22780 [Rhizobium deserti]
MALGDELYQRINCYGIGSWLESLFARAGHSLPPAMRHADELRMDRFMGFLLTFGRLPESLPDPRDQIILLRAEGDGAAPMPFGLNAQFETVESAKHKLSNNIAGGSVSELQAGDRRVSFFLNDGGVVELRFAETMQGFDRILMARLGDFRDGRS